MTTLAPIRVLVCGGREFGYVPSWATALTPEYSRLSRKADEERFLLAATLDALMTDRGIAVIIHGSAHGADELAGQWARRKLIKEECYPARWYPNGRKGGLDRSAGPRRNTKMIAEGKPDLVVAFPGNKGTADMVRRAKAAGIEVVEIAP